MKTHPEGASPASERKRSRLATSALGVLFWVAASPASARPNSPAVDAAEGVLDEKSLLAAAEDITHQVAALRGLEPKRSVAKGVLSREAIGAKLQERIAKEYTPDEIRVESRVLKRLGLLPPDADYQKLLLDLLMEQVAGFYDPFAHKLYIADWLGIDLQRPALAHEIEHALQDQYFDLKAFAAPLKDDGDRQLARSALVEGDGTVVMLEFVAQEQRLDVSRVPDLLESLGKQLSSSTLDQSPMFTRAPRFLRETLLFPYFSGMSFVLGLRKASPWKRVDEAFRSPPESTEQVLHLEKYLAREHPVVITAAPIEALSPRREVRRDVLGELELRVLFASRMPDAIAEKAAAGWGGDRLVAYGAAGGASEASPGTEAEAVSIVDLSSWDTAVDAEEAEAAADKLAARLADRPDSEPQAHGIYQSGKLAFSVERRESHLLLLIGVPSEKREAIAEEVWAKWKVASGHTPARSSEKVAAKTSEKVAAKASDKTGQQGSAKPPKPSVKTPDKAATKATAKTPAK